MARFPRHPAFIPYEGREHSENLRDHARKGSRLMVKGTAGDEGSGIDIEATSLAFDPSHDEPDGNR